MSTQRFRPRGWMQGYFKIPLQLGLLMILADILIFLVDYRCGLVLLLLLAVYLGICIWIYTNHRLLLHKELLTFAEEYGLVQGRLMRDMDLPYALLDIEGHIVWMNNAFSKIVHKGTGYNKSITSLFPTIQRDSLPSEGEEACVSVDFEAESYIAKMTLLPLTGISRNSSYFDYTGQEALITLALSDNTAVRLALKEVDDQSLAVGFIYIDNYEEAMETMEDVRRSLLAALIDRKVSQYVLSYDGISGKVEKDKYLIILRKKSLLQMQEDHFPLIEEAKKVNIGNKMAITLSIGIGLDGLSYNQNYEFARNAAGMEGANSREFDENAPYRVIDFMPGQNDEIDKGGTLRLGRYPCILKEDTVIAKCYGETRIGERHRHRYEFANEYREALEKAGLCLSGLSPDGRLVETVEIPDEDFFVGVQFHPEFKSRPNKPHPLFMGFVGAAGRRAE